MPNQAKFCTKRFVKYWEATLNEACQGLQPTLLNACWTPQQPLPTGTRYNLDVTFTATVANMDSVGNTAVWRVVGLPLISLVLAPGGFATRTITGTLFNVLSLNIVCNITAPVGKARIYDASVLAFFH
jgi:hypothetical protein